MVHEMYHKLWQHIWWADNSAWNIPFFELYISFAIGAFKIYRNHLQFFWYTNESTLHIPKIQEYFWCTERVQMMYWNLLLLLHFWAGCAVFSTLNTLFIFQRGATWNYRLVLVGLTVSEHSDIWSSWHDIGPPGDNERL